MISCACVVFFIVGISATGPLAAADALPASDRDRPAAPNTGTAFIRAFRFEVCFARGIIEFLQASIAPDFVRPAMVLYQGRWPARDAPEMQGSAKFRRGLRPPAACAPIPPPPAHSV
jgi:hypothetical protein